MGHLFRGPNGDEIPGISILGLIDKKIPHHVDTITIKLTTIYTFLAIKRGVVDARCAAPHADHSFTTARSLSGIDPVS